MYVVYINTAFGKAFFTGEEWPGEQLFSLFPEDAEQYPTEAIAQAVAESLDAWVASIEEIENETSDD